MNVESLALPSDEREAHRVATEWLGGPPDQDYSRPGFVRPHYSRFIGSATAFGALRIRMDGQPSEYSRLTFALRGRTAYYEDVQIRSLRPGNGLKVEIEVPEWVSRALLAPDAPRRDFEDVVVDGLGAAVEHIRRNARLVDGRFGYGVLACGKLEVDPAAGRVRAGALVMGVERRDGSLAAVDPAATVAADVQAKAADIAHAAIIDGLRERGYTEAQPDRRIEPHTWVGRGRVWAHDPYEEYQHLLAERSSTFDGEAVLKGEEVVQYSDELLEERRQQLGGAFDGLDHKRLRDDARFRPVNERLAKERHTLGESVVVAEARARDADDPRNLRVAAAVLEDHSSYLDPGSTGELAEVLAPVLGYDPREGLDLTTRNWVDGVELVAVLREQAIRREEATGRERDPPPGATAVGIGDIDAIRARQRDQQHLLREELRLPGSARVIQREDVVAPKTLDRLSHVIGERRAQALAPDVEQIQNWLADQPTAWVSQRHADLGLPAKHLDRRAATHWRLNEEAQERVSRLLKGAQGHGAVRHRRELDRLKAQAEILRAQGHDLNDLLDRDGDHIMRAVAYADEVALRLEMGIAQRAERAVADPPDHIKDLIGGGPEPSSPVRKEWEALARACEGAHVGARADREAGTDARALRPQERQALDERIDALRADRGMEPRAPEVELEQGRGNCGLDGP